MNPIVHIQKILVGYLYFATSIKSNFNVSRLPHILLKLKEKAGGTNSKEIGNTLYYSFWPFVPVFILFNLVAFASHAQSFVDAKQVGKDLANSLLGQVQGSARQEVTIKNKATGTSIVDAINYQGTDVPEKNYTNENMDAAKNQKAADKNNTEASIVSTSFIRAKEYPISITNSFLDRANDAQKNPEHYVDWLSGKYSDCNQEGGEDVLSKSSHTCDEFKEIKDNTCSVGRSIEVDSKHKYICPKKLSRFEKTCTKSLVVAFDKKENCNAGVIEYLGAPRDPAHWSNSGHFTRGSQQIKVVGSYSYPALTINVTRDPAFWGRDNLTYSKKIYFNVKDKSKISSFILNKIAIKGIASVSLNGKELFSVKGVITRQNVGTERRNGGRTLSFINGIPWNTWMGVKRETTSSMDLLPYINNGSNEITYTGLPTVDDNTNIYIEAKQVCLTEKESWLEQCNGAGL